MTTIEARVSTPAKRATPSTAAKSKANKKASAAQRAAVAVEPKVSDRLHTARVTKHDRILELLSRRDGATITEMMAASGWLQHSVRGFLAGTVKKRLGFALTSSKTAGELRRYRIDTKRGR